MAAKKSTKPKALSDSALAMIAHRFRALSEPVRLLNTLIDAENSDLFDVLAHVAYALPPIPRETRAQQARLYIHSRFTREALENPSNPRENTRVIAGAD